MDAVYQADQVWLLDIQRKLYRWSRAEPADAYRDMWNWVSDPRNLRLAWRRVASNRGARSAGPDKRTVKDIQRREGPQRFLGRLRRQLRDGSYRPTPVRRVMIPKRGKPGKLRPLGVPTVKDRVVQAAILQLLEPIFEADFLPVSYGFRPRQGVSRRSGAHPQRDPPDRREDRHRLAASALSMGRRRGHSGLLRPHRPPSRHEPGCVAGCAT